VAARSARLVIAYRQLGTTPDLGLSHWLIERLGAQRALQTFLLSDVIGMEEAERNGLVQHVAEDGEVEAAVRRVVERLAQLSSVPAKSLFLHDRREKLEARLEREAESFLRCSRTASFRESVLAFTRRQRG
jgi:enoyl-CoA hydratase/carnithine racemase